MEKKNYFSDPKRAAVYDRSRPSFHREALEAFHLSSPRILYQNVLDVGCGTGRSSLALTEWSSRVEAVDNSQAMLDHAVQHEKIRYQLGAAESLTFSENTFDLVFVASSLHWFQRRKFLKEVSRVLKAGGDFLIYQSNIASGFTSDFAVEFGHRFPPPYAETELSDGELGIFGFGPKEVFDYEFETNLDDRGVVEYLEGLSNISARLEVGDTEENIHRELTRMVRAHSLQSKFSFKVRLTAVKKEG